MSKINIDVRRKLVQYMAFALSNPHIGNLSKGRLYKGPWKNFCNPGINCYSCPAASLSCPIGSLQAVNGSMNMSCSFYVVGALCAFGILLGRAVCGFLCPFGLIQELLYKIPFVKRRLPRWPRYIKYVMLAGVFLLPVFVTNAVGMGDPFFCKYICPAGTLEGGLPILLSHPEMRGMAGPLLADGVRVAVSEPDFTAYVVLGELVDFEAERARLAKELAKAEKELAGTQKTLSNQGFLAKAAPEIIEKDRAKHADLTDKIARIDAQLAEISA